MKFVKTGLFFLLFIFSSSISAQNHLGLVASVQYGKLENPNEFIFFDSNSTFSFGIMGREKFGSRAYINGVLAYQKSEWYTLNYGGASHDIDLYWKGKSLKFSVDVGYYLINSSKIKIGTSFGLSLAIAINQEFRIVENFNGTIEFYMRQDLTPSLDFNLDFNYNISEMLAFNIRPKWNHFIYYRGGDETFGRNLGLDISIMYAI